MSERYPGGLIRKTAPTVTGPTDGEGGSASGVWKLEDVGYYEEEGGWPKRTLPRELYSWGDNSEGQLGQNTATTADLSSPVQVGALTDWSSIGVAKLFVTAITTTNKLFSWGNNTSYGMLGLGDTVDRSSPVQVGALTNWEQTSGGNETCMAVKTDNTLWFWGRNAWGQRGNSTTTGDTNSPVQVGSDTDWASVSTFGNSVVAVKTNGELYSWGLNSDGNLGHNDRVHRSSPVQIGSLSTWSKAVCGSSAMLAIKTDGTLWAWGQQQFDGKLGDNSKINRSSPVQIGSLTNWSSVDMSRHSAAIKTDGTLWTWGSADEGQLGHNNTSRRSSPVQVGSLSTWLQVSTGHYNCFSVRTDGTAWSWGNNTSGSLGLGDTVNKSSPVQIGSNTDWNSVVGSDGNTSQMAAYGITKGS